MIKFKGERIDNIPNAITGTRVIGATVETIKYAATGKRSHVYRAGAYFALDAADGFFADLLNQKTKFGGIFDKLADKIAIIGLIASALHHDEIDLPVAFVVGAINTSNVAATGVSKVLGNDLEEASEVGRRAAFGMGFGTGFNIIGKNMVAHAETPQEYFKGQAVRWGGAVLAVGTAFTLGKDATVGYWQEAITPSVLDMQKSPPTQD